MGKYMRKCRGAGAAAAAAVELAQVVVGVRTRARSAAFAGAAAAPAPAPKRVRKAAAARAEAEAATGRDGGGEAVGCYLQLRSRRLFMAEAEVASPWEPVAREEEEEASPAAAAAAAGSGALGQAVVTGVSRCSSTASSAVAVAAGERSGGAAEAREDSSVESSVSDSGCGRDRREATPSSWPQGDLSDQESGHTAEDPKHNRRRSPATATTAVACRARMPPAEEIEGFFAAAEKAEAECFAAKYNFEVVRGAPLDAGRFEWTQVASG